MSNVLDATPVLFVVLFTHQAIGGDVTIADIQEQWNQRQTEVQSFLFTWRATRFDRAGALTNPFSTDPGKRVPEADKYTDFQRSLLYDRGNIRVTDTGEYYGRINNGTDEFRHTDITYTWNGSHYNEFHNSEEYFPSGSISGDESSCFTDAQFTWILKAMCAKSPDRIDLNRYRVSSKPSMNGEEHMVLTKKKVLAVDIAEIWVEPTPPYLVRRLVTKAGGVTAGWTEISYRVDDVSQKMIPKSMKYVYLGPDGGYQNVIESEVVSSTLNPVTHSGDFEVSFPVGSLVADFSVSPKEMYILKEGGEKRTVTDDEKLRGATYDELLESESGEAGTSRQPSSSAGPLRWILLVGNGLLVACVTVYLLRRRAYANSAVHG
ncbi:hypothetical protein [Blastopirellula marina]|uniref:hypothetical protein n=1 Tax=Blastopirellula marina TaxID=124 RepID=UPI0011B02E8D|nr:hypothetical protein [Blastopirellula marina]